MYYDKINELRFFFINCTFVLNCSPYGDVCFDSTPLSVIDLHFTAFMFIIDVFSAKSNQT